MHDDDLIDLLGDLDPVGADETPEPGSPRYHRILETAMNTTTDNTTADRRVADASGERRAPGGSVDSPTFWGSRSSRLFVAAAALVVLAVGAMTLRPGGTPSAEAQIRSAAEELGEIESLRATLTTNEEDGTVRTSTADIAGDRYAIVDQFFAHNGDLVESGYTVIDGIAYQSENGVLIGSGPAEPTDWLTPFADASAQVIAAAVTGAEITDLGETEIDGITVDRFLLTMTDESRAALAELTPHELAWFELEYPQDVVSIEVWVADDLIHVLTMTPVAGLNIGVRELRYFDFNEPITIVAPGS
jgi:hypothetical protein